MATWHRVGDPCSRCGEPTYKGDVGDGYGRVAYEGVRWNEDGTVEHPECGEAWLRSHAATEARSWLTSAELDYRRWQEAHEYDDERARSPLRDAGTYDRNRPLHEWEVALIHQWRRGDFTAAECAGWPSAPTKPMTQRECARYFFVREDAIREIDNGPGGVNYTRDTRNSAVVRLADQGWSQRAIAERVGLSQPRVSQILRAAREAA